MTFLLREADLGDNDLGPIAAIVNTTNPDDPTSIDEMRWSSSAFPGASRLIVDIGGRSVGTAGVGRIHNLPMRAVNARLGYQPAPDSLIMRGPLFAGMMTR